MISKVLLDKLSIPQFGYIKLWVRGFWNPYIRDAHDAQLLTYLKLTDTKIGFLLNWNAVLMKDGIRRFVNNL